MKDVELIDTLATRIEQALAAMGYPGVPVIQKHQPTQQGAPTGNQVYFDLLYSQVYGWSMKSSKYVNDESEFINGIFIDKEDQIYNTTIQISAMFPQIPGNTTIPTSHDALQYIQRYIASRPTIREWKKKELSLFRVTEIRIPKFFDDQSQFEFNPNFDIILSHRNALEITTPAVARAIGTHYPV